MVQFHGHIIAELLEDQTGGLVVLSAGLGLHKLVSSLLLLHHSSQGSLLILSASPSQKHSIVLNLEIAIQRESSAPGTSGLPILPSEITSDLPAHQRLSLYTSGGIFFITSRILIVDLLTRRLPTTSVAGIIILNAHSISDTSTEAFIVRIIRSANRSLYIRAFSDRPHAMVSGFARAERTLKCLFLRKLHLWPRFQVHVSQDLEKDPPEVVDIRVPMSPYMIAIQKAVLEVMDACLKEMRKTNKVDVEDLTVENGLFKSFDEILRRQLDPIWHTLGKKTKQLVSDLKTLRKLMDYLVRYDAVTYLKYLDSLRASESFRSVWIFAESSYKIFEYAKKRVYYFGRSDSVQLAGQYPSNGTKKRKTGDEKDGDSSASTSGRVVLQEVLEEEPKWKVLRDVLLEIQEEREKEAISRDVLASEDEGIDNSVVLVACRDERSCMLLESCITNCPQKVMRKEWENYLLSKVELQALPKQNKKKPKQPKGFGVLDGVFLAAPVQKAEVISSVCKQEHDALLAMASEIGKKAKKGTAHEENASTSDSGMGKVKNKKKTEIGHTSSSVDETLLQKEGRTSDAKSLNQSKHLPRMHFYALESNQHILDILKPSVIIVYHPEIAFVREIEIYKAENPSIKVKVYFLFYEDSTEAQKFEASIRRENAAFESLIRQKSLMMIPVDQDGHCTGLDSSTDGQSIHSQNLMTRKAGGKKDPQKEMQVCQYGNSHEKDSQGSHGTRNILGKEIRDEI
ncbi:unnamed protein product [Cuscuta epithymum]|uniref:DNA repair endonuclease UVH1 n=1 Tax=Cuscuta epithymum TaxID=186058 RepID=A0AAV0FPF9_9ASTE|nr:unnamed protein product [Cuscuta epithymum]